MDGYGDEEDQPQKGTKFQKIPFCEFCAFLWLILFATVALCFSQQQGSPPAQAQLAHFHHVHINAIDPEASIRFYTSHFNSERVKLGGTIDAVWAQKSWLLLNKVNRPAPSEVVSSIYHIGWGAEDMKTEYQRQLSMGTKFETPLTDGADLFGNGNPGRAYFAYVEGPDHELIELNTTNNHDFQHVHLLSDDPVGVTEWYLKHFGTTSRLPLPSRDPRVVNGLQVFPMVSTRMDNVNMIWFPKEFGRGVYPKAWTGRTKFETPRGRVIDHFAFSVDNLDETLTRMEKDGVKVVERPSLKLDKFKSAFIEAPDNVQVELVEGHARKE
jgi:catechol 2,3-dioxygenase-like lactoylglutathione lyase family enzyme